MEKHKLNPTEIFNMDETTHTTVHKPPKVIAEKRARHVTSAERGVLTTMIGAVNAGGGSISPMMIFPRVKYREFMLNGAPVGSVGAACQSGWISRELFVQWLKHFIHHTRESKERPVLLLMDNHDSHISIEAIDIAKGNGVVKPHCSLSIFQCMYH